MKRGKSDVTRIDKLVSSKHSLVIPAEMLSLISIPPPGSSHNVFQ